MSNHRLVVCLFVASLALVACNQQSNPSNQTQTTTQSEVTSPSLPESEQQEADIQELDIAETNDETNAEGDLAENNLAENSGPITAFTAYGGSWRATVEDEQLMLESTELGELNLTVMRSAYAKGVEFSADQNGKEILLNIRSQACTDAQGQKTDFTATLYVGDTTYKGCAVAGLVEEF